MSLLTLEYPENVIDWQIKHHMEAREIIENFFIKLYDTIDKERESIDTIKQDIEIEKRKIKALR